MLRSLWKPKFLHLSFLRYLKYYNQSDLHVEGEDVFCWSKKSTILKEMVGLQLYVYNGKDFVTLRIQRFMIGSKIGEFVLTKQLGSSIHLRGKKKKKLKKRK